MIEKGFKESITGIMLTSAPREVMQKDERMINKH
jgi:hypothetical protein